MNTYDKIDLEQLEKSAYGTYNACALMGCLIRAIHDKTNDFIETDEEKFLWQLKGAIEMAENVLNDASSAFFEVIEIIERENWQSSVVKGQGEAETP